VPPAITIEPTCPCSFATTPAPPADDVQYTISAPARLSRRRGFR
jgi:hypothetical protein